jgi:hypothetical protein
VTFLVDSPEEPPVSRRRKALRRFLSPTLFLAVWLLAKAAFDAAVIVAANHGFLGLPEPTFVQVAWTLAEVAATVFAALGLWERARWGWWGALALTAYSVISGTLQVWVAPPFGVLFIVGLAYTYHSVILAALANRFTRREVFGAGGAKLSWLGLVAGLLFGVGTGFLGFSLGGRKGVILPLVWIAFTLFRRFNRAFAPREG